MPLGVSFKTYFLRPVPSTLPEDAVVIKTNGGSDCLNVPAKNRSRIS